MDSQRCAFVLVIDEARSLEPAHEKANARTSSAYHFCQRLMTNLGNRGLGRSIPVIVREQQENTCQPFLARIAMLVN